MNRQDLIAMVVDIGIGAPYKCRGTEYIGFNEDVMTEELLRFAEAVAAHERDACAMVCDEWNARHGAEYGNVAAVLAMSIRNRSNA